MPHSWRIAAHVPAALLRAATKIRRLRAGEFRLLVEAPIVLPLSALALRRWGVQRLQGWLRHRSTAVRPAAADPAAARRIAWCVQVAAAYGPWPANCLQRSVVLWWFLRRRGLVGDLRIGVRRAPDGTLDFHAWVEYGDEVVNDRRDVRRRYATFDRAIAPRHATFT